ncbi:unnamed protein product [Cylindrotheca closterium]|uniref:Uncharacterized protein n=1 Tax=Cylindrotheca closterium TaxID=2856 RepID=A0AAD2GC19_9STRA|nr:unnamed protein product [Cylindrotheca closterium]
MIIANILIKNCTVQAASPRRTKPQRRIASRSRRGLIDSLGALDHTGKAADGWNKILDHLNGSDPPSASPADDRAGTGSPSIIGIPTDPPTKTTSNPTQSPTQSPTKSPTKVPTKSPSFAPSKSPVFAPVKPPTFARTNRPSPAPTKSTPSPTNNPTNAATKKPTATPTKKPTLAPTKKPTDGPTKTPTGAPTKNPTGAPTKKPSGAPTKKPTLAPTKTPTDGPTKNPTGGPTRSPTKVPTSVPTSVPSKEPEVVYSSTGPTVSPTSALKSPSPAPTDTPSESPSTAPTIIETEPPVPSPTAVPSKAQSSNPTKIATGIPSETPSSVPSPVPTVDPKSPTGKPTTNPSESPSAQPSFSPTKSPTKSPAPSVLPSEGPSATPSATPSPTLTMVPTEDDIPDSAVFCPNADASKVSRLEVWWKYSVHFNADVDRASALMMLQMKLAAELEDELLQCNDRNESRRLEEGEGIVGVDYLPLDEQLDEVCPGVSVNCVVYKGMISLYLEYTGNVEDAIGTTRKKIIDVMSLDADGIIGDDISQIEYLSPDMQTSAAQGSGTGDSVSTGESVGTPTAALVSLGVVCAAIALTMGYRYKNRVDDAALSTIGPCGSQLTMTSSQLSGSHLSGSQLSGNTDSSPGLSTMMPSTYRLGESHCMDAILEAEGSDTSSQGRNVSIIISESGYSEEDSLANPRGASNLDKSGEYLLGAHRVGSGYRMGQLMNDSDQLLDDSFSDIQSPYDSSFEEPFPAHRRTYTGQSNALGPSPLAFLDQDDSEEF